MPTQTSSSQPTPGHLLPLLPLLGFLFLTQPLTASWLFYPVRNVLSEESWERRTGVFVVVVFVLHIQATVGRAEAQLSRKGLDICPPVASSE